MDNELKNELQNLQRKIQKLEDERVGFGKIYTENKKWIRFFSICFVMTALIVHATVPNIFLPNTVISSQKMNENFSNLSMSQGTVVAILESDADLSFTSSSSGMVFSSPTWTLNDYLLTSSVSESDGNVSTVGANSSKVYVAPADGWYEIFAEGELHANVLTGNIEPANSVYVNLAVKRGEIVASEFVSKEWVLSFGSSTSMTDTNGSSSININDPLEYYLYRSNGRSEKVFLKAGEAIALALSGGVKLAGDSFGVTEFKVVIKKLVI